LGNAAEGEREEARARMGLSGLLSGRLLLAALSLGLAVAIERVDPSSGPVAVEGVYWTIIAAFLATIVGAYRVERTPDPRRFATFQVGFDVAIVTALVYFSGGGESVFTFLYALVVLYGALFLDRGGVGLAVGLASVGYALAIFGGELGVLPATGGLARDRPIALRGAYWGFYSGALLLLGMLANTLAAELRRTGAALDRRTTDLQRLRDLHRRTVESIGSGLLTTNEVGEITSFNPEAERITGVSAGDAEGRSLEDVIPGSGGILRASQGTSRRRETGGRDRIPYESARGEELFLGLAASRLIDEHGEPGGFVVIFQDVTAIVSMEQDLRQSERLAAVGEMAARMAHEIRNPLASISGSVQMLQANAGGSKPDQGTPGPEQGRLMEIVVREVDRLNLLIGDFLRYSRPAPTCLEEVDLGVLIQELADLLQAQHPVAALPKLEFDLQPGIRVMADPDQLKAVVWNLWNNAIQAMPADPEGRVTEGSILTRVSRVERAAAQAQPRPNRKENSGGPGSTGAEPARAVIEVTDSGPGIPSGVLERIFEPFFTTKREGTGLGLATVQRLIEQHGGSIQVSSRVGVGTRFRVELVRSGVIQ
jgi:two-component system sensor histidine kinase PilS (NtrC family)